MPGIDHLVDGRVDVIPGYRIGAPYEFQQQGIHVKTLRPVSYGIDFYGDSLFTHSRMIEKDPKAIQRFTAATLKGWEYALLHPEEIADKISQDLPRSALLKSGNISAYNRFQINGVKELTLFPVTDIGHNNPNRWRRMSENLYLIGVVKNNLNVKEFIFDPIQRAQDEENKLILILSYALCFAIGAALLVFFWVKTLRRIVLQKTRELLVLNHQLDDDNLTLQRISTYNRILLETNLDPLVIIGKDEVITDVNKATEHATGFTREQLIGTVFSNYFTDPKLVRTGYLNVMQFGQLRDYPVDLQHKDGRIIHSLCNASVYLDDKGEISGVFVAVRDVSEQKRVEKELLRVSAYNRILLETSLDPLVTIGKDGKITDVNKATEHATGISREQLIGTDFSDYFTDPEQAREGYVKVFEYGLLRNYPLELRHKDGNVVNVLYNASVYLDEEGDIAGVFAAARDVTERKHAEDALLESEGRLRSVSSMLRLMCDNVTDMIWAKDLNNCYTFVNKALCQNLLNATNTDEPIGKTDLFFAERERNSHPDDPTWHTFGEICRNTDLITLEAGGPKQFDEYGNVQGKFLFLDVHKAPFINENGQVIGTVGSARDITELKRAEEALRESEQKFRIITEQSPNHIFIQGCNLRYEYVLNPQLELTCQEMIGKSDYDILPFDEAEKLNQMKKSVIKSGNTLTVELCLTSKSGVREYFEGSYIPKFDSSGRIDGILGYFKNVTERKRNEDALRQLNRQLNLLTSITRHDILNKVNTLQLLLNLVKEKADITPAMEYFDHIESVATVIQSQIEFTRVYEKLGSQDPQWLPVRAILLNVSIPESISYVVDIDDIEVYVDPLFERVFYNLLDNSVRHGQGVSVIRAFSQEFSGGMAIIWEDNGIGISADEKMDIFDRGHGKNTGLGLFFIREILSITGLTITETGEEGKGVRFEILIPRGMFRYSGS